jgi:hypothetical protein
MVVPGEGSSRRAAVDLIGSAILAASIGVSTAGAAQPADLFISEYVDGAIGNKAIEIFNGTGATIDLGAGAYGILIFQNGSVTPTHVVELEGSVAHDDVFVVGSSTGAGDIFTESDLRTTELDFNGNDAVALVNLTSGAFIDLIGQTGVNPQTGWGTGEVSTNDHTLIRKPSISSGRTSNDAFDPVTEWDALPFETTSDLGSHTFDPGPATDTGVVDAAITMADSTLCLELSTSTIDFGNRQFGATDVRGNPDINVTNCSESPMTLLGRGTDATAPGATWSLVDNAATCADTLGTDTFHLTLKEGVSGSTAAWRLGKTDSELLEVPAGAYAPFWPTIDAACPGSSGAGLELSMQISFTAIETIP